MGMARARTKAHQAPKVHLATLEFRSYTLTAVGPTEYAAKQAVLRSLRKACESNGGRVITRFDREMSVEKFWEYAGGHLHEMEMCADAQWL
jgi:hypothetical protein